MKTRPWPRRPLVLAGLLLGSLLAAAHPALAFDQELKALAAKLSEKISHAQKTSLAVVDFGNLEGTTTLLGRFLAEEIANDLGNTGKGFEVVDRNHLNSLLKEHKLSSNGFIDQLTATRLGSMIGAQALVLGTITPFGDSLRITAKVLDTKTGKQIAADSTEFAKTKALEEMYDKALPQEEAAAPPAKRESRAAAARQEAPAAGDAEDDERSDVVELQDIRFQLVRCQRGSQSITCSLAVQSLLRDAGVCLHHETRLFDESGAEYAVSEATVAKERKQSSYGCFLEKTLVKGVRTPMVLVFRDVAGKPRRIASLELNLRLNRNSDLRPNFRDISLAVGGAAGGTKQAVAASRKGEAPAAEAGDDSGSIMDTAIGAAKGEVANTIRSLFGKLKKKAKIPDDPPDPQ